MVTIKGIKKEKLLFESLWIVLSFTIAMIKLYLEYFDPMMEQDYFMVVYSLGVFIIPNCFSIRVCVKLFTIKYKDYKFESKVLENNYKRTYALLYWGSLIVIAGIIVIQSIIFNFMNSHTVNVLVFVLVCILYGLTLLLSLTSKIANYLVEGKE